MPKYLIQASYSHEGRRAGRRRGRRATTTTTVLLTPEQVDDAAKRSIDSVDYHPPGTWPVESSPGAVPTPFEALVEDVRVAVPGPTSTIVVSPRVPVSLFVQRRRRYLSRRDRRRSLSTRPSVCSVGQYVIT
jgi:hypothetical protein